MKLAKRASGMMKAFALVLSLALPLMFAASVADARIGGGKSYGSRGARTFSAPPVTSTAPNAARPLDRTMAQPGRLAAGGAATGRFNRPGMGMLGGLAAGFLGAGLLGLLFGGGLFGGLGGLSSIIGLVLQIGLIYLLVRFAMSWWQRRNAPAYAGPTPGPTSGPAAAQTNARSGLGFGSMANAAPLEITQEDYEAFERLLGEIQTAWSNEDVNTLHALATPEMVSYFTEDLQANDARGVVNKVSDVKLLQGDLAEAWREGMTDYATVALRYSLIDKTIERAGGRIVEGSDQPQEATDVWTFARRGGGKWELSAIQQT
ncbi:MULTISPECIES: TIM44-like domain-containing protein [unclassified Nitrobacter]|uniref:Tim44 domain-containing protein n=1 Tax=unclassified Nitrobacter TaxID=2620411 RepID=UPI0005935306|nr:MULTISPECIES: TIM44-like domain-containing protein [unclassified Nitrobacter]MCB1392492.1 TIM44-like domain-containing protein [Nitrobacter sp.]MCV0385122.1 TIM44-like domain-containing protein [Nitrobacter sp.]